MGLFAHGMAFESTIPSSQDSDFANALSCTLPPLAGRSSDQPPSEEVPRGGPETALKATAQIVFVSENSLSTCHLAYLMHTLL